MSTSHSVRSILLTSLMALASFGFLMGTVHAQTPSTSNTPTPSTSNTPTPSTSNTPTPSTSNTPCNSPAGALQSPLNSICDLPSLLHTILQAVVELGSIALSVMLVYVGFLFVVAQGNPEKISSARSALIWTLIGGLILLGAEAISQVIQATVKTL